MEVRMIMKNLDKKCYGKFRKTKAYGLVGCLAFSGFLLVSGAGGHEAHAAVVNGGSDIVVTDVHSKEASGVAMTYTTFDSNGSKQVASGSGVFVAPNVMVTVAHNYLDKNKEAGTSFVRADKFERTVSGQVDGSGGVNLPKIDDKVKNAPNGERNFGATAIIRTPDGTGSGTLIGNDLVLTVAHNFLKFENGKVTEKAKGDSDKKYYMALPNGKKVFFTDSDIYYWKKDDSVVGFTHDLALIKLREVISDAKSADVVSDVPTVNNGDKVSVYGYPDGRMGPVIDTAVTDVVDRGAGLTGIGYTGTKPGASGGGLYNDKGEIIGVHQNGVVNQRSGGLVFSKEQLDWVRSYMNGKPEAPVYKAAVEREDPKGGKKVDYTLDENPYLIVDETKDMHIEKDPGLVKALETINAVKGHDEWVKEARSKIEKLMNMKTGVVYKVRIHEANGKDGWRYFRTWTKYEMWGNGQTQIPYISYESDDEFYKSKIAYNADDTLSYGKARGNSVAYEETGNIALARWNSYEPEMEGENPLPSDPDLNGSFLDHPTTYAKYAGDDTKRDEHGTRNGLKFVGADIGAKPEETEEVIEKHGVKYVRNEELTKLGLKERVVKEGSDKIKRTKKVYTLLRKSDERASVKGYQDGVFETKGTTAPSLENGGVKLEETVTYTNLEDKVIEVAIPGDKMVEKILEPEIEYVEDPTRERGTDNIVTVGPKGKSVTTITYEVDPKTGKVTEVTGKPVITPAGKTIIKVGTQEEVTTEVIDPIVTYVGDDTKPYGSEPVVKKGVPGYKKKITEYDLNPKTGVVTPKERVEAAPPKSGTIITVGTKPKVVIVKRGAEGYEVRTEYTVDLKTGKITEKVTERLLYKVGDDISVEVPEGHGTLSGNGIDSEGNPIAPPVVNIPEYTGVLSGNGLDGDGGIIEPPVVKIPEYTGVLSGNGLDGAGGIIEPPVVKLPEGSGVISGNGIDENGNPIAPPVVDIPEYKGELSGNGLDGEGGIIEPPVVEIAEYKGDMNDATQDAIKKELPKVVSTPQGKGEKVLPNTGSETTNTAGLGLGVIAVGAVMVKQRRKLGKRQ